jgi:hypothetical protein
MRSQHHGSGAGRVDVKTRVVSVFRYGDGRQLERWFYPDDTVAWNKIFDDDQR